MRSLYVSLLATAALAIAALAAPAISSAAVTCPPGQEPIAGATTQPYCKNVPPPPTPTPTPTPTFVSTSIGNEVNGTVKVTFLAPGPGTLKINGKAIKGLTITVDAKGNVTVKLKATGKVLQHLNNRGWTKRKQIYATFVGTDGTTSTVKVVIRFRKP